MLSIENQIRYREIFVLVTIRTMMLVGMMMMMKLTKIVDGVIPY